MCAQHASAAAGSCCGRSVRCGRSGWMRRCEPADATRAEGEERRWSGRKACRRARRPGAGRTGGGAEDGRTPPRRARERRGVRRMARSRRSARPEGRGTESPAGMRAPPARAHPRGERPAPSPTACPRRRRCRPAAAAGARAPAPHPSRRRHARRAPRRRVPARRAVRRKASGASASPARGRGWTGGGPKPVRVRRDSVPLPSADHTPGAALAATASLRRHAPSTAAARRAITPGNPTRRGALSVNWRQHRPILLATPTRHSPCARAWRTMGTGIAGPRGTGCAPSSRRISPATSSPGARAAARRTRAGDPRDRRRGWRGGRFSPCRVVRP